MHKESWQSPLSSLSFCYHIECFYFSFHLVSRFHIFFFFSLNMKEEKECRHARSWLCLDLFQSFLPSSSSLLHRFVSYRIVVVVVDRRAWSAMWLLSSCLDITNWLAFLRCCLLPRLTAWFFSFYYYYTYIHTYTKCIWYIIHFDIYLFFSLHSIYIFMRIYYFIKI